ncbi:MAG: hypothetical protein AAF809_13860 [Bacteroidota bacterium]
MRLPLAEVWDRADVVVSTRRANLMGTEDLRRLLRSGPIQFVIANVGDPLDWIPITRSYDFWKSEVKPHLADPAECGYVLEDFPGSYFYISTRWLWPGHEPLVTLETFH